MRRLHLSVIATMMLAAAAPGLANTAEPTDGFTSENAVLDTSIPFAIGAREATQELRGAFGWPTFQEGMVEGVYFRFDPDGYARFAPTPRLDSDIFEVVCRPRTLSCMGRKDSLTVFLNARGQFELRLDEAVEGDQLFLSQGVSEIQLPEQILMPLTTQLETLLSSGGELVIRSEGDEKARVSLTGFSAVTAYLRWVAAKQDYTVLPRGWPVPNTAGLTGNGSLTQPQSWVSPMPQPQTPSTGVAAAEVAEVRGELNVLRDMLLRRSGQDAASNLPVQAAVSFDPQQPDIAALEQRVMELQRQLEIGRMNEIGLPQTPPPVPSLIEAAEPAAPEGAAPAAEEASAEDASAEEAPAAEASAEEAPAEDAAAAPDAPAEKQESEGEKIARQIAYLITEIGLDPQTAVMLLQMRDEANAAKEVPETSEERTVARILDELGLRPDPAADVPVGVLPARPLTPPSAPVPTPAYNAQTPGGPVPPAPGQYAATPDQYAVTPDQYTATPGQYGAAPGQYAPAPQAYPTAPAAGMPAPGAPAPAYRDPSQGAVRAAPETPAWGGAPAATPELQGDYMLLTDYFQSVLANQ